MTGDNQETDDHQEVAHKPGSWNLLKRSLSYTLPHWRRILLAILLMVLYTGSQNLRVGMVGLLLDGVLLPPEAGKAPSKISQLYEDYVADFLPVPLLRKPSSSYAAPVTAIEFESGAVKEIKERRGGKWVATVADGKIRSASLDADSDGISETPLSETPFRELSLTFHGHDPGAVTEAADLALPAGVTAYVSFSWSSEPPADSLKSILIGFAILGAALSLIIAGTNYGREYLSRSVIFHSVAGLRADVFRKLTSFSVGYFSGRRSGDLLSRATNDVNSVQLSYRYIFGELLQQPISIVVALVGAFAVSWQLTLMVAPFLPLLLLPMLKSGKKVKKHGKGMLGKMGEVTQVMSELLSGIRVVKAFGMEGAQHQEFDRKNAGFIRSSLKMLRAKVTANSVLEGTYNLLAALLLAVGAYVVVGQWFEITFADFAMFLIFITMIYKPVKHMTKAYNTIQESLGGAERVFEILDERPSIVDGEDASPFAPLTSTIAVENLSFRYDQEREWVLRDVCFEVTRGETIALVGPSGAGKSTLLDLLSRFSDPVEGRILLDGRDLRDGAHNSLLEQIAIVGQEPFLFHTTIAANIRFGRPGASQDEIEAAAKAAAIHDEILELPENYETVLGDRGQLLSGGQRQRITIARAIIKGAEILILDEATSSLDSESERKVQKALANLMAGKTTFVIAHRLSTIKHADRILVMEHGRIVEIGSHDQLANAGGLYSRLLEMQESPIVAE